MSCNTVKFCLFMYLIHVSNVLIKIRATYPNLSRNGWLPNTASKCMSQAAGTCSCEKSNSHTRSDLVIFKCHCQHSTKCFNQIAHASWSFQLNMLYEPYAYEKKWLYISAVWWLLQKCRKHYTVTQTWPLHSPQATSNPSVVPERLWDAEWKADLAFPS